MQYKNKIKLENRAMKLNLILLIIMSFGAFFLGKVANSSAIIFDGIFSFTTLITVIIGIIISKKTLEIPNRMYPLGKYQYNTIFELLKTFTLLFLVIFSFFMSLNSIIDYYFFDEVKQAINFYYANIYYLLMFLIKPASIILYSYYLHKTENSNLMKEERIASITDALLTFSIFIGLTFLSKLNLIEDIADDLVLIIISLYLLITLSKEFFSLIGQLNGERIYLEKENSLTAFLNSTIENINVSNCFFQTIGENYEITIIVTSNVDIKEKTKEIKKMINEQYESSIINILWGE